MEWVVGGYALVTTESGRSIHKVESITKAGNVKVDGRLFDQSGRLRGGDRWCRLSAEPITDDEAKELAKEWKQNKFIKQLKELVSTCTTMTYEQAKAIKSILDGDNDVKD